MEIAADGIAGQIKLDPPAAIGAMLGDAYAGKLA
jgi:hypothetical protein